MKLAKALNEKVMDVRLMDRLLAEGKLEKSQVDEYIASLEDNEGLYEKIQDRTSESSSSEA